MNDTSFSYKIEFPIFANPPGRKAEFEEGLSKTAGSLGLDCLIGALGGGVHIYGIVTCPDGTTENHRHSLVEWMRQQPVKCIIRVGPIGGSARAEDLLGDLSDLVVSVDNLSPADHVQAAEYGDRIKAMIQKAAKQT